jgi:hypothetical protein
VSRYFTRPKVNGISRRPRADWIDDDLPLLPNIEAPDHEATFTGLLDSRGGEIWANPRGMGFGVEID